MEPKFKIEYRFWLTCNSYPLLGKGKVALLQKIEKTNSLRKAAEELKISYRKAYYSVNQMNNTADEPLVRMKRGGKQGGKSELTPLAKKLVALYLELETEISAYIASKSLQ